MEKFIKTRNLSYHDSTVVLSTVVLFEFKRVRLRDWERLGKIYCFYNIFLYTDVDLNLAKSHRKCYVTCCLLVSFTNMKSTWFFKISL